MDREAFLHLLSLQPDSDEEQTEYLFNPADETWHVVWDEAADRKLVAPADSNRLRRQPTRQRRR